MLKKFLNGEIRFEDLKDGIFFRVCNKDAVGGGIHKDVEDLALTYWIRLAETTDEDGRRIASMCGSISEAMLDLWGVTVDELDAVARRNTERMHPAEVKTIFEMLGKDGIAEDWADDPFICVTTEDKHFGAVAAFYDGMLDRLAETIGGDFYLIPSSVHEMLALRQPDVDPEFLKAIIRDANETAVDPEDVLSDHPYRYLASERRLVRA